LKGTRALQRLKQHNIGMSLRLTKDEILVGHGPAFPSRGSLRWVRIRVERSGYAEATYHEIGPQPSVFTHRSTRLDAAQLAQLGDALQAALAEKAMDAGEDANSVYRTIELWADTCAVRLCVEYVCGLATPPKPAFEAVWHLLETKLPVTE
jgi:hypothetical protein